MNSRVADALMKRLILAGALCFLMNGASRAGTLALSDVPLFLLSTVDPNVLIDLSVETPMGGAAYADQPSNPPGCVGRQTVGGNANIGTCYSNTSEYLGYFDSNKCYAYDSTIDRFNPSGATNSDHECSGAWSGNFLNWVSMTAIDEFIWAMTGGNRVVDTTSETVIRRSRKTNNDNWFPRKVLDASVNVAPSTVTPFTDGTIWIHNTDFGMDVGTTFASATSGSPDRGSFNIDVKVCDSAQGLEKNCVAYGGGSYYKPEGLIQQNANQMRFGVMAYTLDNTKTRDGGVLRSNMKYIGSTYNVPGTGSVANAKKEYGTDGLLINDPDGVGGGLNSGVINYINQFSQPGLKSYDPVSELFYEAVRYYKHLAPTPEYSSGLSGPQKGGFQIVTTWEDPIQYRCQKNFIIAVNDAYPWRDKKLPGTAFPSCTITDASGNPYTIQDADCGEPSNPDPDINVTELTNKVGDLENAAGGFDLSNFRTGGGDGTWTGTCDAKSVKLGETMGTCSTPAGGSTSRENSYYVAGLAYYANATDIRHDLDGKQTVSTFMIDTQEYTPTPATGPINPLWLAGKYGGFKDSNNNNTPDLGKEWDANGDKLPDNYVLASQPQKLVDGLARAFKDVQRKTATAAAVALNSRSLNTQTRLYQAQFVGGEWSGDLVSIEIKPDGTIGTIDWHTDDEVEKQDWQAGGSAYPRQIVSWNPVSHKGVPFEWSATPTATTLDATQQSLIDAGDGNGQQKLEYLRGDHSNEGNNAGQFRPRTDAFGNTFRLGDIVNSGPIYVGAPPFLPDGVDAQSVTDNNLHSAFRAAKNGRVPMVYVGANDGMLHGFNACNTVTGISACTDANSHGKETVAYVPSFVYPNLNDLTNPNYSHKFYVDATPTAGDAYFGSAWHTMLVSGVGAGGQGYFGLDVTDPEGAGDSSLKFAETNAANIARWEFGDRDDAATSTKVEGDPDMGYSIGQATIAKMHNGAWAAIFGNGYNSTVSDGSASATGNAVLFIVDVATGDLIAKIETPAGMATSADFNTPNGLATPAVIDADGDGVADYVFAGDLQGNLWKFDVTAANANSWGSSYKQGSKTVPLFRAVDDSGAPQPITIRPEVSKHPAGLPGFMVYFGTGKYLENADRTTTTQQTFYGIWDSGTTIASRDNQLLAQTITTDTFSGVAVRTIDPNNPLDNWGTGGATAIPPEYMGWRVNLPVLGERVVFKPVFVGGENPRIIFTTLIPNEVPCDFGGESWLMELNPQNGGRMAIDVFDVNGDGIYDKAGSGGTIAGINPQLGIMPDPVILKDPAKQRDLKVATGTSGDVKTIANSNPPTAGSSSRKSWRQLR